MTDTAYPITYQRETAPSWLNYAAALSGGGGARDLTRPFRYLELGCGRGYSALLHAAGHPAGDFVAVDRDEAAIAQARAWAERAGVGNARFMTASFDDSRLRDLPPFDFIVLHGVYSWVYASTRAALRALLRDLLLPGGLCYVSYNCLPGWAAELPLRRLLNEFSADGDIAAAVSELENLRGLGLGYFKAQPAAARAVKAWAGQPAGYLAQEYLGQSCEAFWSVDAIEEMASAGLSWIASATLRDAHIALLIDDEKADAIAALETPRLRTLAMDLALNRSFRRDVFAKGARAQNGLALGDLKIVRPAGTIPDSIVMPRGRIRFQPDFVEALACVTKSGAVSIRAAAGRLGGPAGLRNLLWMIAAGVVVPAPADVDTEAQVRERVMGQGVNLTWRGALPQLPT